VFKNVALQYMSYMIALLYITIIFHNGLPAMFPPAMNV